MQRITFEKIAFNDFVDWSIVNKIIFKRIVELIKDISRQPYEGIGNPEPLKYNLSGTWSRKINNEQRLVYFVSDDGTISIVSCKGHYPQ